MKFGNLKFAPAIEHPELLAAPVASALTSLSIADVGVAEIDPALSDTAAFCEKYAVVPAQAANCVVLKYKKGEESAFVACVILATTRADVNGLVRKVLDIKKISFAPMEEAVAGSSMEFGAITPIGLPANWPILIDKAVVDSPGVIIGSGIRKSKLGLPGRVLASLPNIQILEGLGQVKT
ncbi:MAG TPA: YbaK/EbsC family protein [Candidatus Paceibacterota bacterium]|nr:YbaK/EbsC family protein [Candidatus Paceibacterota bacterium]